MIPVVRQQTILEYLSEVRTASVGELATKVGASPMTIRRDIQKLEAEGRLVSVAGGVSVAGEKVGEAPLIEKRDPWQRAKSAIAARAADLVERGCTIFLDAGTTTMALARRLAATRPDDGDLLVVTNDLFITAYLAEKSPFRLFHIGGMVVRENYSCVGESAAKILRGLSIDIAFIGTPSWDKAWLSTSVSEKSPIKRAAIAAAVRSVLLSDSGKYGKIGAFKAVPVGSLTTIITDAGLSREAVAALGRQGVELLLAETHSRRLAGSDA